MASRNQPSAAPEEAVQNLVEIDVLRRAQKISAPVFAGVCAERGWRPGKMVTEAEFRAAVAKFTGAVMGGQNRPKGGNA